ncbi:glycosyltransferase [Cohnella hashimotonis]|uniref:Glycosyltransferase n=1 Tax=Cohnella hashimotonis TaxID=2826895 RepID=A0ABT6TTX5_9BACL|nr:glycosyltransferase [Cohnella hashimotonis]MDI4650298.1 glycosyltransferase [Cohnella hashimotonis]
MSLTRCDIIIPVYNALEELRECIDSLLKHTERQHQIIIINDKSPDPAVADYLNSLKEIEGIKVSENENNLGFVGTVNKGMRMSNRDVILLNSDTVVTDNWLNKLIIAAESDETIATVTPLTNNGTICSVPVFNEDNEVPEGFTLDYFSYFIEEISLRLYPEIPTAVGFCMYIKRKVIDEIGYFDENAFGKGYGEENDFCCRALEQGYVHILADDTYVYHKGSMSFQGEKLKLIQKNIQVLLQRYPYYNDMIQKFISNHSLDIIHENIDVRINQYRYQEASDGNVLYVLHNFFDEAYNHPVGGTEYHVKDLVTRLEHKRIFVMVSNGFEVRLKCYYKGTVTGALRFKLNDPLTSTQIHHREYASIVRSVLETFNIDVVHIHHLIRHSFDSVFEAKKLGINVIISVHDLYLLSHQQRISPEAWNGAVRRLLTSVDRIICPSMFIKESLMKSSCDNSIEDKIFVIEHGIDSDSSLRPSRLGERENRPLRVCFLGGLSPTKGSESITKLIRSYKKEIEWYVVGGIGDPKLQFLEQENLMKIGPYERKDLEGLLNRINPDLICLLSTVPESFSYTLSEAWAHRIPVLVTPVGALKERVLKTGGGWIADSTQFDSILQAFKKIIGQSPQEWNAINKCVEDIQLVSIDTMVEQYARLYTTNMNRSQRNAHSRLDNKELLNRMRQTHIHSDQFHDYELLRRELELIKMTIGWRVLNQMRTRTPRVLLVGKKLLKFVVRYGGIKKN